MATKNQQKPGEIPCLSRCECRVSSFTCIDCGKDTRTEYYMVWDWIWRRVNTVGMLHVRCLENRLGRLLVWQDFMDCPLNGMEMTRSPILINRMTNGYRTVRSRVGKDDVGHGLHKP